jgi:hypothetical protein
LLGKLQEKEAYSMNPEKVSLPEKQWTAAELRKLPAEQRNAILEAAAALAEDLYRANPELTDFEAFGDDDLYGESTAAPEGGNLDGEL